MSAPPKTDRQVFPRWRGYNETVATGELAVPPLAEPRSWTRDTSGLERRTADFSSFHAESFAADLVGSSLVFGATEEARNAASRLLRDDRISPLLRIASEAILDDSDVSPAESVSASSTASVDSLIRNFRAATQRNPTNAIRWSELARAHTSAGHREKARRAMAVARGLAPDNRYVLRCAARFAIYDHDPAWAQRMLSSSVRIRDDPWLLAAEIAASNAAEVRSRYVRVAQQLITAERFSDFELAELRAALATLEAHEGDDRASRRLFRQALEAPTDNAIAQAEWASQHIAGLEVSDAIFEQPRTWEARALHAADQGEWQTAVQQAWAWLDDQPFARRPAELGSYQASAGHDFETGASIAKKGLEANPGEFLLLNNAAFCLASLDRVDEAARLFGQIQKAELDGSHNATYLATSGLIAYRSGRPQEGRRLYEQSISLWRGRADRSNRALAQILNAREELLAQMPDAGEFVRKAEEARALGDSRDIHLWFEQLHSIARAPSEIQISPTYTPGAAESLAPRDQRTPSDP